MKRRAAAATTQPTAVPSCDAARLLALECGIQYYAWGDPGFIPGLLGIENREGRPFAELWMGAHPDLPSRALVAGRSIGLDELIAGAPEAMLGPTVTRAFGELPYLFKVLAAASPLSLQAHPSREAASAGFSREDAASIPRDAPQRTYRDQNHKPELLAALSDFYALHGFRPPDEIAGLLRDVPELRGLAVRFQATPDGLRDLYGRLMTMPQEDVDAVLGPLVRRLAERDGTRPFGRDTWEHWILRCDREHAHEGHHDRGLFSVCLLNLVRLRPGEALYQPPGVLHAYLAGCGMEVMANSNNVLRGGLTRKRVDVAELLRNLRFEGGRAEIIRPARLGASAEWAYRTPAREFELRRIEVDGLQTYAGSGEHSAEIVVVIEAEGGTPPVISSGDQSLELRPGHPCLVPHGVPYTIASSGRARLFKATVPLT
jgi:mannose-6-phosphate isomerase class I